MTKTRNRTSANGSKPDATQQDCVTASIDAVVPRKTKAALLRAMLEAPSGASLTRIMEETGWQAHTVRAALTSLRKAGLHLTRCREGNDTIYAVDTAALSTPTVADGSNAELEEPDATLLIPDDDGPSPVSAEHHAADTEASA